MLFNNVGETVQAMDGPGIVAAEINLTERARGQYRWDDDANVDKRETKWYQRWPELFGILTEKKDIPHPLDDQSKKYSHAEQPWPREVTSSQGCRCSCWSRAQEPGTAP